MVHMSTSDLGMAAPASTDDFPENPTARMMPSRFNLASARNAPARSIASTLAVAVQKQNVYVIRAQPRQGPLDACQYRVFAEIVARLGPVELLAGLRAEDPVVPMPLDGLADPGFARPVGRCGIQEVDALALCHRQQVGDATVARQRVRTAVVDPGIPPELDGAETEGRHLDPGVAQRASQHGKRV